MAKKVKWISKVRRFFVCAKEDLNNESGQRTGSRRKNVPRKLKKGERKSFISLLKEPSSIEKILEDAEREQALTYRPSSPLEQSNKPAVVLPKAGSPKVSSPRATSPRAATLRIHSPKATSPRAGSLRVVIPRNRSPRASPPREVSPIFVSPKADSPKLPSPRAVSPKARSPKADSFRVASLSPPRPPSSRGSFSKAASFRVATPRDESPTPSPPRPPSSRGSFLKAASLKKIHREPSITRIDPVFPYHHVSATKIQAAYRGFASRKITGSARGLVRLQKYARGHCVKRQTANAMKRMQLLLRVQTRLQSLRFQMLECYALQHESDKQTESVISDAGNNKDWDDSILKKEEKDARTRRKEEAVRNKERAIAFLRSHQMSKFKSETDRSALMDLRIDGLPWSWNWSERHLLKTILPEDQAKKNAFSISPKSTRSSSALRGNQVLTPPRNSRSLTPSRFSQLQTPDGTPRSHYSSGSLLTKYFKPTVGGSQSPFNKNFSDTDSLRSCPTFSVPCYMSPTISASAKFKLNDKIKDRYVSSRSAHSKRRLTFPLTPRSGTSTSQGPLVADSDAGSQRTVGTNCSSRSNDNISVGTPVSLPDSRKPVNRFV